MSFGMGGFLDAQRTYIQSAPVEVHMAGFRSDTISLQNNGWQISMEKYRLYDSAAMEIRVAFKHDGIKQVALGILPLSNRDLMQSMSNGRFVFPHGIHINCIAPMIRVHQIPISGGIGKMTAIDARPQFAEAKDLTDIAIFKPIKTDENFEIYINQKDEAEILDILLKKQDPKQKEIRQNQKRQEYLMGQSGQKTSLDGIQDRINTDIRAQLLLVS